jgi:hypothetical protein
MIDWEKALKEQIKKNLIECEEQLENNEYRTKIKEWCDKFDFDFDLIFAKAQSDPHFRAFFAKDPKKQNIYEKTLGKYINSFPFVFNFQQLSSGGKNALYIDRGVIRRGSEYPHEKPAKSVDFFWNIKSKKGEIINFYAFHKYIEESGGAQDNQFNEIKKCIEVGRNGSQEVNRRVVFVCDGVYFTDEKIKILKNLKGSWNFIVLRSGELEKFLRKV